MSGKERAREHKDGNCSDIGEKSPAHDTLLTLPESDNFCEQIRSTEDCKTKTSLSQAIVSKFPALESLDSGGPLLTSQEPPGILEGDPSRRFLGERGQQLSGLHHLDGEMLGAIRGDVRSDGETVRVGLQKRFPFGAEASVIELGGI